MKFGHNARLFGGAGVPGLERGRGQKAVLEDACRLFCRPRRVKTKGGFDDKREALFPPANTQIDIPESYRGLVLCLADGVVILKFSA